MLVRKWMTPNPRTVQSKDSISEAIRLMDEGSIRHLPVLDGTKLVGVVSDRDIKEFSPSRATTLDVHELHYVLSRAVVADAMKKDPLRVQPSDSIERAAALMHDNKIGCLPVVDGTGLVVGILTQEDVFEALITILGARMDTVRFQMTIPEAAGAARAVIEKVRSYNVGIRSALTSYVGVPKGSREFVLHLTGDTLLLERDLRQDYPDLLVHRGV